MEKKNLGKKIIGSVAVDSQTGLEHYQVPKAQPQPSAEAPQNQNEAGEKLRENFQTPNYGEHGSSNESQNLAGVSDEFMHLFEHDPSEVIVYQTSRHPIGVLAIFMSAGLAAFTLIAGYVFLISDTSALGFMGMNSASIGAIGGLVLLVVLVMIAAISLLAANVYKKSRLILTNQKVVFIQYHSLISREVSQLNIGEVEDVNVSQPTLWDRIFKTGRITIETAGEQNNYVMTQVENPYDFARQTIQMHEGAIAEYGN